MAPEKSISMRKVQLPFIGDPMIHVDLDRVTARIARWPKKTHDP